MHTMLTKDVVRLEHCLRKQTGILMNQHRLRFHSAIMKETGFFSLHCPGILPGSP